MINLIKRRETVYAIVIKSTDSGTDINGYYNMEEEVTQTVYETVEQLLTRINDLERELQHASRGR